MLWGAQLKLQAQGDIKTITLPEVKWKEQNC